MILHVDMDAFFVAVEELLNPALRGKPVVVGGSPSGRGVVASASYEARKFGIRSAMPSIQAKKLCPHVIFVPAHFDQYAGYSDAVARILARYSPEIEWVSIDEAYINFYGCERLLGNPSAVAEEIHKTIEKEVHLPVSIGIGRTRMLAKIASDYAKPNGLCYLLPGHEQAFLNSLPIHALPGVGEKMEKEFQEMGIETIGDLARMPLELLEAVYGTHGVTLWKRAHGYENYLPAEPPMDSKSISREMTLQEDSVDEEYLLAVLHRLIEKAASELRRTRRKVRTITLRFRYSDFKQVSRSVTLEKATNLDEKIYEKARELFKKNWQRRVRIRLIGIHLSHFEPETGQLELFPDIQEVRARSLHEQIDRLREKFGFHSLQVGKSILLKKAPRQSWETENGT